MATPSRPSALPWSSGRWTHPPVAAVVDGDDFLVTALKGSDAWRHTSYGFVHDSEHALLADFPVGVAAEVTFTAELPEQFDQAGVFVRVDEERWVKAGLERSDGSLQLGAVVTDGASDWSVSPVDGWAGQRVTIRVSRTGGALIVRARVGDDDLQFMRVTPLPESAVAQAGPYTCSPTRAGLTVRFHAWHLTDADTSLH
ncbi:MAG: DUF1349 domain-containing protein [Mobilicoccus sp.]|nr:DUF1349 domain-containing protein [Mobilicoccus sp.]